MSQSVDKYMSEWVLHIWINKLMRYWINNESIDESMDVHMNNWMDQSKSLMNEWMNSYVSMQENEFRN